MLMSVQGSMWEQLVFGQLPAALLKNITSSCEQGEAFRILTNSIQSCCLTEIYSSVSPPSRISNCFLPKALKMKQNQKTLEQYKRSSDDFQEQTTYVLEHLCFSQAVFFHYCHEKRRLVECFSREAQVYNTPC